MTRSTFSLPAFLVVLALPAAAVLVPAAGRADLVEIALYPQSPYRLGDVWVVEGIELSLERNNTAYPGRVDGLWDGLRLSWTSLQLRDAPAAVRSIAVLVKVMDGRGPTYLMAHKDMWLQGYVASRSTEVWETLTLDTSAFEFDEVHIACDWAIVRSIVIRYGPVPVQETTWGGLKSLYR